MATEKANATKSANVAKEEVEVKKVSRRGVGAARGTQRLKFSHELAKPNGLFIAHLASVDLSTITIGEDKTGMPSFNGLDVPRIVLTFASNEKEINKRHFVTVSFTAVESNANTIPGGKEEWKVNAVFDWFKHILNVYVLKGRDFNEEEEAALSLGFEDFDEEGNYVPVDAEEVIAAWKVLFENFENLMNRGGSDEKPVYKTKDGGPLAIWAKLLRYNKHKTKGWTPVNNGDLSFPTFVGEGCIELFVANQPPSIRLDAVKEAIIPMNVEKAKTPNMGGVMGGPGMGGVPVGDPATMGNFNGGFPSAAMPGADDDLPF